MPKQVEYEGTIHEFPDDFTDDDIARALKSADPAPESSIADDILGAEKNLGIGLLKGAGAVGLSADPVGRTAPVLLRMLQKQFPNSPQLTKLADAAEKVKAQNSEFVRPEGGVQEAASFAAKAIPSTVLAMGTAGTSLPVQGALQGVLAAMQSEGETPAEVGVDTALGVAAPFGARLVDKVLKGVGGIAVRMYEKALNPTTSALKKTTKEIVPQLLDKGVAGSLETLAEKGAAKSEVVGQALQMSYDDAAKAGVTVNANQLVKALEAAKEPFLGKGKAGTFPIHQGAIDAIEAIQETLKKYGKKASPAELWKYRRVLDDVIAQSGGFTKPLPPHTAAEIAHTARGVLQDSLSKAVPDVAQKNAEYKLWQGLEDVAKATVDRKTGQSAIVGNALKAAAGSLGGAAIDAVIPGDEHGAAIGAVLPYLLTRPASRTGIATGLHAASGPNTQALARILATIGISRGGPELAGSSVAPGTGPLAIAPPPPDEEEFIRRFSAGGQ